MSRNPIAKNQFNKFRFSIFYFSLIFLLESQKMRFTSSFDNSEKKVLVFFYLTLGALGNFEILILIESRKKRERAPQISHLLLKPQVLVHLFRRKIIWFKIRLAQQTLFMRTFYELQCVLKFIITFSIA